MTTVKPCASSRGDQIVPAATPAEKIRAPIAAVTERITSSGTFPRVCCTNLNNTAVARWNPKGSTANYFALVGIPAVQTTHAVTFSKRRQSA
jgi:hypothetical protein